MKTIGKPDAGKPHVRFERGPQETEPARHRARGLPMPKLTLRDLFAVVTIVALALGLAVDYASREEAKAQLLDVLARRERENFELKQALEWAKCPKCSARLHDDQLPNR